MKLSEKIRTLRKNAGLSQEQLGEKINVSRQAITKWESGDGIPDIYNLVALSNLFSITLDELMAQEKAVTERRFLYESHVEYDIDRLCKFDMNLFVSSELTIRAYDGEKLQLYAGSREIKDLDKLLKVKTDDSGRSFDVDIRTSLAKTICSKSLTLEVLLPQKYIKGVEVTAKTDKMTVRQITAQLTELDTNAAELTLDDVHGTVDITGSQDMKIICTTLHGDISVNQTGSVSHLLIPAGTDIRTRCHGINTRLITDDTVTVSPDAPYQVELNGFSSELTITH
ncbi:MAG: helix-turn-helix transcriptional regulator [Bacteroidaceae bacterium]|nr:helix-turn-helix transcriptional regulator [Bacteroidaceae bacterium]